MERHDAIVVGGGLSGWIAAALLAKGGKRVLVAERARTFGGRAATIDKSGVQLNLGAHAVYRDGELPAVLAELGIQLEGGMPEIGGHFLWQGQVYRLPASLASLALSPVISGRGKVELARLMMQLKQIDASRLPDASLRDWVEESARDPMVRRLLYSLARTGCYADDPDHQLAGPVLRQMKHSLNGGALYVHGGWGAMVAQLRRTAAALGVRELAGQAAERVTREPQCFTIQLAGGERLEAEAVVLAVPPAECCRLVPGAEATALGRYRDQARPVTAACLDLGMRRLPRPELGFVMGADAPFLLTNQSRAARLSSRGLQAVHLLKYHGTSEPDAERDRTDLERNIDQVQPGWRSEVEVAQYLPRMTVVYDYDHTGRLESPGPAVPEITGLYVAGDWAGHGELLADAAAASAARAVRALLAEGGVSDRKPFDARRAGLQPV